MRKLILATSAAAMMVPAALPAPAMAQGYNEYRGEYRGRAWQGRDGRYYCKKPNGTTGLLVGGAAGALAGRAIDTRGERTTGTVLGAAVGALLGRHVERNATSKCR